MNRNVDIEFGEEKRVEIQPVTQRKTPVGRRLHCNFWVGWRLFSPTR